MAQLDVKTTGIQTVITRFLAPTDTQGARVKARTMTGRHSVTLPWDYEKSVDGNHETAAAALVERMEWDHVPTWRGSAAPENSKDAFIFVAVRDLTK